MAAVLVVAVVVGLTAFPATVETAACRVVGAFQGGGGDCGASAPTPSAPTDDQLLPAMCLLAETTTGGGASVDIAFVTLGADWQLQVADYGEDVHAALTNGASAGVQAKAETDVGAVGVEASASLEGTYKHGDTWVVPKDEWPEFKENAETYFSQAKFRWLGAGSIWGAREPRARLGSRLRHRQAVA